MIKLERFDEAIEDCTSAIKLNPELTKAHVHLAKALQGRGDFRKAIDILELAEDNADSSFTEVIRKYKAEAVRDMKRHLLQNV